MYANILEVYYRESTLTKLYSWMYDNMSMQTHALNYFTTNSFIHATIQVDHKWSSGKYKKQWVNMCSILDRYWCAALSLTLNYQNNFVISKIKDSLQIILKIIKNCQRMNWLNFNQRNKMANSIWRTHFHKQNSSNECHQPVNWCNTSILSSIHIL